MNDVPIIDRARLALITRGDSKLAQEFLSALFDEADQILKQLDVLVAGDDRTGLADAAHTLKGMAGELGAMRLRAAALELESEKESGRWTERVEYVRTTLTDLRSFKL